MDPILRHRAAVLSGLEDFIANARAAAGTDFAWQADFLGRLQPFATAGKLLRGGLVCFSYEAFSGKPPDDTVIRAAAALELTHSALLIHDDIMDKDDLRRGQPSMHRQYRLQAAKDKLADPDHFGTSMALGGGDLVLFLAFDLLAGAPVEVRRLFTAQLAMTCAGQMQDMYLEAEPDMPSKKAIEDLMAKKTASYSFSLPLAMGAAFAGQPQQVIEELRSFGVTAGIIFQIRDDELGVMGDSKTTGKPVGSDITEGKKTLLAYYLFEQARGEERRKLRGIFGNGQATARDISYVQELVERRDVRTLLNHEIDRFKTQAGASLAAAGLPETMRKTLAELVEFCARRQS